MRDLIGQRWEAVWKAVPVALAGNDIEGVHDVRVASRRLRAAMDVATECFPDRWYGKLHRTAKEITGALGEVRERDVLLEFLAKEHLRVGPEEWPGLDRLIERTERDQRLARRQMETFLTNLLVDGVPEEATRRFPATKASRSSTETSDAGSSVETVSAEA